MKRQSKVEISVGPNLTIEDAEILWAGIALSAFIQAQGKDPFSGKCAEPDHAARRAWQYAVAMRNEYESIIQPKNPKHSAQPVRPVAAG